MLFIYCYGHRIRNLDGVIAKMLFTVRMIVLLLLLFCTNASANNRIFRNANTQRDGNALQKVISGIVTDVTGLPLPGASVIIKGTATGIATDVNGKFTINANVGDVLVVSFIGYLPLEHKVTAADNITLVLTAAQREIDQVVVTALGIKKSVKALTYNVQEIKSADLTRNKDANFVNALSGKIAGVTINASSAGIGGATRVVMRGAKSISDNNNVLYVVDGIPIPNTNGGTTTGPFAGVVSGEGISSINPEDIESVTALTGPSATALYGNQGANGVIVVTTKKGSVGNLKINLSHSSDFFQPFVMPQFQDTYGQENEGTFSSWGAKMATPSGYRPRDFFQTGNNIFNAISLSGGTEKSQTFFSAGVNNANGIIRKNTFDRYNFYLRHTVDLTDKLTVDFSAMYARLSNRNMIAQGQYHNPLVPIYLFPPGDDIRKYQVYSRFNPDRKISSQFWPFGDQGLQIENPYWITDAEANTNKSDRFMLSGSAKYKLADWMDVSARVRIDNTYATGEITRPAGTNQNFASVFGYYATSKTNSKNTYIDLIATIRRKIFTGLNFTSNVGGSFQDNQLNSLGAGGNLTRLANFYSVQENVDNPSTQDYNHTQLQSVFATTEFAYQNWLFLHASGRYEWPSQLPSGFAEKSSYFYPSVGMAAVLSDKMHLSGNSLSFAKVRLSYAEVGTPPLFGKTNPVFSLVNEDFRPAPFADYQPERTRSYEAGAELKFLHNKLSLNATVYKSNTTNQLLEQPLPAGNLYTVFYYNAGNIQNKGIEASLGYNFNLKDVSWSSNVVFTLNRNKVIRLSEGFKNPVTGELFGKDSTRKGGIGDLENVLVVGGSLSDLYISQVLREDNQGNLWQDPATGAIARQTIPRKYIGYTTPDYTIGWRNNLAWKNIELSFLIDARVGGVGVSYTQAIMDAFGVSKQSADDRDNGGVMVYGKRYADVKGYYNLLGAASGGSVGMSAYYVYRATNVRLREAALTYALPGGILGNRIGDVKLSLTGRNLFMFYNKSPFDPESTSSTGTYDQGIDYFRQPSYRSFGFSIRAQF